MTDITECHGQCRLADVPRVGVLIQEIDTLEWMTRVFYHGDEFTRLHVCVENVTRRCPARAPMNTTIYLPGRVGDRLVKQMLEERLAELHSLGVWMPDEVYPPAPAPIPVPLDLACFDNQENA